MMKILKSTLMTALTLLIALTASSSLAHANLAVTCTAKGKSTAQSGGRMLYTDAVIRFDAEGPADPGKQMVILGVTGTVKVSSIDNSPVLDKENAYIGYFRFSQLRSNLKYRPLKYKNMVQFKNFDAVRTAGLEDGMWGSLLIDRELNDGAEAKYVFQAGDHMGGTVHLKCRVQD